MKAKVAVLIGIALGVGLAFCVHIPHAEASRNASGTYSLPNPPVVTATTITSTWANTTLADIKTEITSSLDRSGRGAMLAALQLTNGTVAAPSLTFATDPDNGLYRIGANNPGMSAGGVKCQEWAGTGSSFPLGVTVTQSQNDGGAVVATGNWMGPGVTGNGGAGASPGVAGFGLGAGYGVFGQGGDGGSGVGVWGSAGVPNGNGVQGAGAGTGSGTWGTGGPNGGTGVSGIGGASSGSGVVGIGGSTNGVGVLGAGTGSGSGVSGTGGSSGLGGQFTGGASGGGIEVTSGTSATPATLTTGIGGGLGLKVKSSAANVTVAQLDGYLSFASATAPASSTGFTNRVTPLNIVKAHGFLTTTAGAPVTVNSGFNLTSASCASEVVTVTLASAMSSSTNYTVILTSGSFGHLLFATITGTTTFKITSTLPSGGPGVTNDLCAGGYKLHFMVLGEQ